MHIRITCRQRLNHQCCIVNKRLFQRYGVEPHRCRDSWQEQLIGPAGRTSFSESQTEQEKDISSAMATELEDVELETVGYLSTIVTESNVNRPELLLGTAYGIAGRRLECLL